MPRAKTLTLKTIESLTRWAVPWPHSKIGSQWYGFLRVKQTRITHNGIGSSCKAKQDSNDMGYPYIKQNRILLIGVGTVVLMLRPSIGHKVFSSNSSTPPYRKTPVNLSIQPAPTTAGHTFSFAQHSHAQRDINDGRRHQ